ncbi:MAG: bifunctional 4-hydroxy-2-oxoglutarate aldolase/2-dehydro-3-deoxy-phosphogluconate aldolase [Ferrimonas sp.]
MTTVASLTLDDVFACSPVIPVLVIKRLEDAIPMVKALADGGINVVEITLRTECALDAIRAIRTELPEVMTGAGTVLTPEDLQAVVDAGGQFIVTPGATEELLAAGRDAKIPFIPGVASVSEAMTAMSYGHRYLKFFPAEANGGVPALKSLTGPLQGLKICATGGIKPSNMNDYLSLSAVPCIGGTWLTPDELVDAKAWDQITALAKEAIAIHNA